MTPPLCWRQARCPRFGGQLGQHPEEVLCKCDGRHICCDVTFWSAHAIADVCGSTGGQCPAYQQANLVILPKEAAVEFAAFCTRNPKPCPLIEITPPGDPEPARSAPGADLRTDLPGYRVYRGGEFVGQRGEIHDLWRDDLVAFLLGCSLTFEHT
jgi:uncharacterized protein YcsI (UPF0317 family)